jgi:hypothetical protein
MYTYVSIPCPFQAVNAEAGGRIVAIDNFFIGGVDDVFFVHNRLSTIARNIYSNFCLCWCGVM